MAIEEYCKLNEEGEHVGNLNWCQMFYDAIPKNYGRKNAFVFWLAAHTPVVLVEGKFKKDKSEKAKAFNLEGALAKPFWEFAPEKVITNYDGQGVVKEIMRLVNKLENEERAALDADGAAIVAEVKKVAQKHVKVNAA
jgi:hypothetical protein